MATDLGSDGETVGKGDGDRDQPGETGHAGRSRGPVVNALIGAVVTVVTVFVPFSPVLGGGVAGYLQRGGDREGLRVGALSGLIASVPVLAIVGVIIMVGFFGVAVTGEVAIPLALVAITLFVSLFVIGYTVVLSAIGGFAGAAIANTWTGERNGDRWGDGE